MLNWLKDMTILKICAKCSDRCHATLRVDGSVVAETDGYVPEMLGGGDYVELDIDVETGKILNWKVPTQEQIEDYIDNQ